MAKSSNVYIRVEPEVKAEAEKVFNELGLNLSGAVNIFLKQVVIQQGIPFPLQTKAAKPRALSDMTREELNAELEKGYADYLAGSGRPAEEVFRSLHQEFGA